MQLKYGVEGNRVLMDSRRAEVNVGQWRAGRRRTAVGSHKAASVNV